MLDRTIPPPSVRSTSFNLITPEEVVLPNGIPVCFIPGGSQNVLRIECVIPAGRWFEEVPGCAYFTAHLLARGTKGHTSFEIARILDQLGAHLQISPGFDFINVAVYGLNSTLDAIVEILMELLSEPLFPQDEFDQMRDAYLQGLRINNQKTSFVASKVFRKNIFGETHPYGREAEEEQLTALTANDLFRHFNNFVHTPRIFLSGKITPENRDTVVRKFAALRTGTPPPTKSFPLARPTPDIRIPKEGSLQSSIRVGKQSVLRTDPDYPAVLFISHILGGYFGSRLMKNIREEKGLTYGIHASLAPLKQATQLVIGADVNNESVPLAFDEIREEIRHLRESPVPQDELETSRNHFIGSLQAEITTPFAHADKIKTLKLFALPDDHYQRIIRKIEEITPEEIMATSEKHLNEESFTQVAVG